MEARSIFDIAREVFQHSVFHLFQTNDLLRLRRSCKYMKRLSDDYLRLHPRSQRAVYINLNKLAAEEGENDGAPSTATNSSLKSFLEMDSFSTIKMPASRFRFGFPDPNFHHPLLPNFLQRYGKQMKHVEDLYMPIPLREQEFDFFRHLGPLKSVTAYVFQNEPKIESGSVTFPECFKKLQHLHLYGTFKAGKQDGNYMWELIDHCQDLRSLSLIEAGALYPNIERQISNLEKILGRMQHKKLKALELIPLQAMIELDPELEAPVMTLIRRLFAMGVKHDLRLLSPPGCLIAKLTKAEIEEVAKCFLCIATTTGNLDFKGVPLPNLEEIQGLTWPHAEDDEAGIRTYLKPALFPRLTRLDIAVEDDGSVQSASLEYMWSEFPNMEEIRIFYMHDESQDPKEEGEASDKASNNDDWSLLGSNLEEPAFLKLQKLRKLSLEFFVKPRLTDAVFIQIIRNMRLCEFILKSCEPVDSFTDAGIRALLAGPFRETIEYFPFEDWKLADLTDDEFLLLAREFPCNSPL